MIKPEEFKTGRFFVDKLAKHWVLSPYPVDTGAKAADGLGLIYKKNDVYLDISRVGSVVGLEAIFCGYLITGLSLLVVYWFLCHVADYRVDLVVFITKFIWGGYLLFILFAVVIFIFTHKNSDKGSIIRFNRQRREVTFPVGKKPDFVTVPWEKLYVSVVEAKTVTEDTFYTQASLVIVTESLEKKDEYYQLAEFLCGDIAVGIMQWECIRTYMEKGPDACPKPSKVNTLEEYLHTRKQWKQDKLFSKMEWFKLRLADLFFGRYWVFKVVDGMKARSAAKFPAEVIERSKPLPEEQWVKPSDACDLAARQARAHYLRGGDFGNLLSALS